MGMNGRSQEHSYESSCAPDIIAAGVCWGIRTQLYLLPPLDPSLCLLQNIAEDWWLGPTGYYSLTWLTLSPSLLFFSLPQNIAEDWRLGSTGCYDTASLTRLQCKLLSGAGSTEPGLGAESELGKMCQEFGADPCPLTAALGARASTAANFQRFAPIM